MNEGIFVIAFPNDHEARTALQILKKLDWQKAIRLRKGTALARYEDGTVGVLATHDLLKAGGRVGLAGVAGGIVGFLGTAPLGPLALLTGAALATGGAGAALGYSVLQDQGDQQEIVEAVKEKLPVGSSAIVATVSLNNLETALQELSALEKGKIIYHSLSEDMYNKLAGIIEN